MADSNYLAHYGVLGMRWGIRRSREVAAVNSAHASREGKIDNASDKRSEKSFGGKSRLKIGSPEYKKMRESEAKNAEKTKSDFAKENTRYKSELAKARAAAANRLYPLNGKATNDRVAGSSMGKIIAQTYLMSSYGALKYNAARSNPAVSRGQAAVNGILHAVGNVTLSGWPEFLEGHANRMNRQK